MLGQTRSWRLLATLVAWAAFAPVCYVLSEGPARWLVVKLDLDQESHLYNALTVPYRAFDSMMEQMPSPIYNADLDYLDLFAPGWITGTAIFLD